MGRPRTSGDAIRETLLTTNLPCVQIAAMFGVSARTVERASGRLTREGRVRPARTFLPCGTYASYERGCRCPECRAANTTESTRRKALRAARLAADPAIRDHGLYATYANWGCRCVLCKAAAVEAGAHYRATAKTWNQSCGYIPTGRLP